MPEEPKSIVAKEKTANMEVSMPIFVIGIKDTNLSGEIKNKDNIVKKHIAIEILLNMIIGKSSKLYKELYETGKLTKEVYLEYEFSQSFAHIAITGQGTDPKIVMEKVKEEIEKIKTNGINEKHFNRIKKMIYGNYVREYDDVSEVARMFISDYFKGINSFEYIEVYDQVTIEYAKEILEDVFKEENMVISIVKKD